MSTESRIKTPFLDVKHIFTKAKKKNLTIQRKTVKLIPILN